MEFQSLVKSRNERPLTAALGSEGSISLIVGNQALTTVKIDFQCGYAQSNFAKASVSDNSLDVIIKAGSGDDGFEDMETANPGSVPSGGHPLYVTWEVTEK
ncbi:hypothetical protein [Pseudoalteromonas luteoviolacea]|uniref:hypothetical protein n=1 Tax=Pseudoalteromonas luteoviolacea TaxID=43657 RepID=UPI00040CBE8D|nr:hypothetical protein [Pseudoalteromonas luteoviolacea]